MLARARLVSGALDVLPLLVPRVSQPESPRQPALPEQRAPQLLEESMLPQKAL